jgi:predicted amidohydrolase YtcJ
LTRYLPRLRWWIGGLLFASTVINYIDRQTLSVLAPFLKRDYHWSNTDFATVLIAFRIAYTIGQGTIGRILDKLGTRRGLSLTVMFYSVVATLTATAQGIGSFRFFRFLLGAGEAANWPGATKAVSEVDVLIPCLWGLTLSLPGNPSAPTGTHVIRKRSVRAGLLLLLACCIGSAQLADTVMLGGKILVLDGAGRTVQALAIRGGRIVALGSDAEMRPYTGQRTKVIPLNGHMVVPGLIESHAHALGVAREEHDQPYAELSSIPEVQAWIRTRAKQVPPGTWIRVPRNDLTRLKERRHPTPAELDAACTTHPVIFTAVMKNTFNTAGWRALGITPQTKEFHRGQIVRDSAGGPVLLVGADSYIQSTIAAPKLTHSEMLEELPKVLTKYSEVGITAIGERRTDVEGFRTYQDLEKLGRLPVRATVAINLPERTPEKIEAYVRKIGVKQGDGDDWVKVGILKLAADGGIHWGTTALGEPYGLKRMSFYRLTDPDYRGFYYNTDQQLRDIFETANRIGWQVGIHATGDAAVEQVLNAVEAADRKQSVRPRRFTLIHGYFPAPT